MTELFGRSTMRAVEGRPRRDRFAQLGQELRAGIDTINQRVEHVESTLHVRIDGAESRLDARIDALAVEMRQQFEQTRRHFDVVAESLVSKIQLVAEGVVVTNQRQDRLQDEVRDELERVDARVLRLEARVSALEHPRP